MNPQPFGPAPMSVMEQLLQHGPLREVPLAEATSGQLVAVCAGSRRLPFNYGLAFVVSADPDTRGLICQPAVLQEGRYASTETVVTRKIVPSWYLADASCLQPAVAA